MKPLVQNKFHWATTAFNYPKKKKKNQLLSNNFPSKLKRKVIENIQGEELVIHLETLL